MTNIWGAKLELEETRMLISARPVSRLVYVALVALLVSVASAYAQQTTGQLLILSGFSPVAATTPDMVSRLTTFPAHQFVSRNKQGRTYYVYADLSGCTCAYVGERAAMDKYRTSFAALPADTLLPGSSGGFTNPEQNMINSMEEDEAGADVFAPRY
ncbi:hypothetical protein [Bradyrhizobium sp. LA7.1]|uniref:hypothetical protein n=1 Tax=unclassified Bradyrhizobium TaxID=2631580 RepID=UPI00339858C3